MSEPSILPPATPPERPRLTTRRIVVWAVGGAVGIFLVISGIIGILEKA